MRFGKKLALPIAAMYLLLTGAPVQADDAVTVPDSSLISWQMDASGKVWLRNLDQFNSTFLGCCYNYYIDLTTVDGKAKWATMLTYIASGKPLIFFVINKSQVSQITLVMNQV